MTTQALNTYQDASLMVSALLDLESRYADPPLASERSLVEGLRGGAVVMMVGAFENYIKESFAEVLHEINTAQPRCEFSKLPMLLQTQAVWTGLDSAMKARPGERAPSKEVKLPRVLDAVRRINNGEIIATSVAVTSGNPDAETLKDIYKFVDLTNALQHIKRSFDREWGAATAQTFIVDTLNAIVGRRHVVAHTASIATTSRADLANWHNFLNTLSKTLDVTLERQVARIIQSAQ